MVRISSMRLRTRSAVTVFLSQNVPPLDPLLQYVEHLRRMDIGHIESTDLRIDVALQRRQPVGTMLRRTPFGAVRGDVGFGAFLEGLLDGSVGKFLGPFGTALVERVDLVGELLARLFGTGSGLVEREGAGSCPAPSSGRARSLGTSSSQCAAVLWATTRYRPRCPPAPPSRVRPLSPRRSRRCDPLDRSLNSFPCLSRLPTRAQTHVRAHGY